MQSDLQIIADILDREGEEFTDRPADRGGPTKWGVTLATFRAWLGDDAKGHTDAYLIDALKDLPRGQASDILEHLYLTGPGFHLVANKTLRALLVDSGVQHGVVTTIRMLQKGIAGLKVDGILGPATLSVVNGRPPTIIYAMVLAARCRLYGSIISRDPKLVAAKAEGHHLQAENAGGWANRLATFIEDTDLL